MSQTGQNNFKDPLLCQRQFLATEGPLKMMKNAFYFMLKGFFVHYYRA